jgi:hypothetical protein
MGQVKTLVEVSGKVTTVHTLAVGNVYKRLVVESYGPDKVLYGVVTDVQNNGEQSFIIASEFNAEAYGGDELKNSVFGGDREVNIFSCSVEDFNAAYQSNKSAMERSVNEKFTKAESAKAALEALVAAAESVTDGIVLTEAEVAAN